MEEDDVDISLLFMTLYATRPNALGNICLADFAAYYTITSSQSTHYSDTDNYSHMEDLQGNSTDKQLHGQNE